MGCVMSCASRKSAAPAGYFHSASRSWKARPRARQELGDPLVVREDRFIEAPPIDEGALFRPAAPHQVTALVEAVEHGLRDVVRQQKIGSPGGIFPLGIAQLEGAPAREG